METRLGSRSRYTWSLGWVQGVDQHGDKVGLRISSDYTDRPAEIIVV